MELTVCGYAMWHTTCYALPVNLSDYTIDLKLASIVILLFSTMLGS